jgi:ABC-type nitrate/sulfonate/bicarbonate transport system substrate-binding protein
LLAILAHSPAALAEEASPMKVTIGTSYLGVDSMPIYISRELGYFREEHLNVDLIYLATGDKIVFALRGGSINVARYTPDWIIRAIEKGGARLKIVLAGSNNLVFSLIATNDVQSYTNLKGRRIGVSTIGAADSMLAQKMLTAHGPGTADYSLIQAGSSPERAAALRAGSLAATLLTPPINQKVLDEGGFKRLDLSTNVVPHYAWGAKPCGRTGRPATSRRCSLTCGPRSRLAAGSTAQPTRRTPYASWRARPRSRSTAPDRCTRFTLVPMRWPPTRTGSSIRSDSRPSSTT